MSTTGRMVKRMARGLRRATVLISDDPFLHHRLAAPAVRLLSFLPGRIGLFWNQILDYLEKPQRAQTAILEFEQKLAALPADAICLDLGANVGTYTRRLAQHAGHVHAFEPDPWAFAQLSRNLSDLSNVTLHNAAVSDRAGYIRLHRDPAFASSPERASLGSSILSKGVTADQDAVEVECIALQDFVAALDADVTLVKMDIEGAEVAVLNALYDAPVLDRIGSIFVETHYHTHPEQIEQIASLKRRYGALKKPQVNFDWP